MHSLVMLNGHRNTQPFSKLNNPVSLHIKNTVEGYFILNFVNVCDFTKRRTWPRYTDWMAFGSLGTGIGYTYTR